MFYNGSHWVFMIFPLSGIGRFFLKINTDLRIDPNSIPYPANIFHGFLPWYCFQYVCVLFALEIKGLNWIMQNVTESILCVLCSMFALLLLSLLSYRQDEWMDILTRFIDYHYKSIVSTIRERHVLTLHLSTANWRKLTGSCCKNVPVHSTHYVISTR